MSSSPVESLGAGLVGVDLGQSGADGRVGGDQAVDVRVPEEPPDAVQHGVDRGVPQPTVVQVADVELEVGPLWAGISRSMHRPSLRWRCD